MKSCSLRLSGITFGLEPRDDSFQGSISRRQPQQDQILVVVLEVVGGRGMRVVAVLSCGAGERGEGIIYLSLADWFT